MSVLQSGITKSLGPPPYEVDYSCRVYSGSMSRTPSVQGSLQKLTISMWVKAGVLAGSGTLWGTAIGGDGEVA